MQELGFLQLMVATPLCMRANTTIHGNRSGDLMVVERRRAAKNSGFEIAGAKNVICPGFRG